MSHNLETAKELHKRSIEEGAHEYFEFVQHRLEDALQEINREHDIFKKTGDYKSIMRIANMMAQLETGVARAIRLTHRIALLEEEVLILKQEETDNEQHKEYPTVTLESVHSIADNKTTN